MSKTDMACNHLRKHGSITSLEAINLYGDTRLSAIIYNLRANGMNIVTEKMPFVDRFGNKSTYGKYILQG